MQRQSNNINFFKELMYKIKNSDESAFTILYNRLWERMYALAFSLLKNKDLSKDLVQEVFIDFWERRLSIESTNIEAYLIKAIRFRVYKELRDSKLKANVDLLDMIKAPHTGGVLNDLQLKETQKSIDKAIDNLPKKRQQVFTLSRYSELNNYEISQKLGISKRTVETQISLAIRSIKSEIGF
ncbi:RNA polymerase sigma-70 factor, ECF subfamily [Algibacter lectus]|uniref:RNA polymerase sigma-70 factor n=1 Tax=Algibacter lectus TaxID=221126 RepID=UPI0008EEB96B|nr:RNA polymerase sigma-70 factor [Algibacter lectus]SFD32056.1 RNA polymerase sigma-70 factor, ECF subfamily [Algibacter lectus]